MSNIRKFFLVVFAFVIGLAIGIGVMTMGLGHWSNFGEQERRFNAAPHLLLTVPDLRQDTDYSCGASALQAVFAYWGIDLRESSLREQLHSNPQDGTKPEEILRVAKEHGLSAEMREGLGIKDLRIAWEASITVILDIQAWKENLKQGPDWKSNWEDGHYVVLIGMDERNIYVEDPSLLGSRGIIPQQEFLDRWHDYEGDPPYDSKDRAFIHMGLFIEGKIKNNAVTFNQVN